MNLFGLEGSGFIISLGITLLLSGLIMYYCVQRINTLEQSLVKQGEIIQTFIYKLNNLELQCNSNVSHNNLVNTSNNQMTEEKIDISDSDSDSGTDNEHDDKEDIQDTDNNNIKLLTIDSKNNNFLEETHDNESISDSDIDSDSDSDTDIEELKQNNIISSSNISSLENLQDISLNTIEKIVVDDDDIIDNDEENNHDTKKIEINNDDLSESINYNKMKVNDLKELAVKKNLVKSSDNTKYKKDELIQLLQK